MGEVDFNSNYWTNPRHLDYHRRQFSEPYRSTVAVGELLRRELERSPSALRGLDVACGAGSVMAYFSRMFSRLEWTGFDLSTEAFQLGRKLMTEQSIKKLPDFVAGDLYQLNDHFARHSFDVVLSLQTLSWMPSYEPLIGPLLSMAKPGGLVVISSLFTDALVDANISLRQYADSSCTSCEEGIHYNIYCLERFAAMCRAGGAKSIEVKEFEMDRDLPKPNHRHMGTYTETLANGRRIQISGPLLMPWRFVIIRM